MNIHPRQRIDSQFAYFTGPADTRSYLSKIYFSFSLPTFSSTFVDEVDQKGKKKKRDFGTVPSPFWMFLDRLKSRPSRRLIEYFTDFYRPSSRCHKRNRNRREIVCLQLLQRTITLFKYFRDLREIYT